MRLRQARALFVTFAVASGITAAFGTPWSGLNEGWRRVPEITVVSAAGDPRIAVVEEAIDFWNRSFAELRFRDASLLSFDGSRPRATASLVSADLGPLTAQTRSLRAIVAQREVTCARFVRSASIGSTSMTAVLRKCGCSVGSCWVGEGTTRSERLARPCTEGHLVRSSHVLLPTLEAIRYLGDTWRVSSSWVFSSMNRDLTWLLVTLGISQVTLGCGGKTGSEASPQNVQAASGGAATSLGSQNVQTASGGAASSLGSQNAQAASGGAAASLRTQNVQAASGGAASSLGSQNVQAASGGAASSLGSQNVQAASGGAAASPGTANDAAIPNRRLLASGQVVPGGVTADHENVYWYNAGTWTNVGPRLNVHNGDAQVMKCAIGGCDGRPVALATHRGFSSQVVVAGNSVYFSDGDANGNHGIYACSVSGCSDSPNLVTSVYADTLATDGTNLFWSGYSAYLGMCQISQCDTTVLWNAGSTPAVRSIAVDSQNVYAFAHYPSEILVCPRTGCSPSPTLLVSSNSLVGRYFPSTTKIALDAENVYIEAGDGLYRCAKSGCNDNPTQIASGLASVTGIATDGNYVYWIEIVTTWVDGGTTVLTGALRKCPVGGCEGTPTALASDLVEPNSLFVDDTNVYVTDGDSVWSIPK